MHEMYFFTPKYLLSDQQDCDSPDIENLSSFYKFDCTVLVREFTIFRPLYRKIHSLVNVIDLLPKTSKTGLSVHLVTTDYDTDDESESDKVKTNTRADMNSIKPLRAITKFNNSFLDFRHLLCCTIF